jgi:hypothetical protein
MEVKGLKRQLREVADEFSFRGCGDQVRLVAETLRPESRTAEQIRLLDALEALGKMGGHDRDMGRGQIC